MYSYLHYKFFLFIFLFNNDLFVKNHFATKINKYSAAIMDTNSGKIVYGIHSNEMRHPASITKMMTLSILFDALNKGIITMNTMLKVSHKASMQSPTKIGLKKGSYITVKDCILAIAVRSANDAAMVVAENLLGSEENFVAKMNSQAIKIGMRNTKFMNPTGLPNKLQVTTARDLCLLARNIYINYNNYIHYMRMKNIIINGSKFNSTNKLLDKVNGILMGKTGYTCASGFNLITLVHRNNKNIIVVVMGGDTGKERDNHMHKIIDAYYSNHLLVPKMMINMSSMKNRILFTKKILNNKTILKKKISNKRFVKQKILKIKSKIKIHKYKNK